MHGYSSYRLPVRQPLDSTGPRSTVGVDFGKSRRPDINKGSSYRSCRLSARQPLDRASPDRRPTAISEDPTCLTDTFRYLSDACVRRASREDTCHSQIASEQCLTILSPYRAGSDIATPVQPTSSLCCRARHRHVCPLCPSFSHVVATSSPPWTGR